MDTHITKIQALSAILKDLLPMKKEDQKRLDKKFSLEFNYNSSHIEGNTLNYDETERAIIFGRGNGNHSLKEYDDMRAHDAGYEMVRKLAKDREKPLTEAFIKDLNGLLLVSPFWKRAVTAEGGASRKLIEGGRYKEKPNHVQLNNGKKHWYATPEETPALMGDLMEWYRERLEKRDMHPAEIAAKFHHRFVNIHPFDDGNGRIARLILNYILLRHRLPPLVIKSDDKNNYLDALRAADSGQLEVFVQYIFIQLVWSLELSIKAARGQSIDERGDLHKKLSELKKSWGDFPTDPIVKKSGQSVRKIVEEVIIPIATSWEQTLKHFDSFFFSRQMIAQFESHRATGEDLGLLVAGEAERHLFPALQEEKLPLKIDVQCSPRGLRKVNKDTSFNGGTLQFYFFDNAYEISSPEVQININKLYAQILSPDEIEEMIEKLGTFLLNNLEQFQKSWAAQ